MVRRSRRRLSVQDQARLEAAVAALERQTCAELSIAVAQRSASYAAYPAVWAACIALVSGWIMALIEPDVLPARLIFVQATVLLATAALLYLTPLGLKLVPGAVKRVRAAAMARVEFTLLVNDRTHARDGVLVYVSIAERYVEIIADAAVAAVIPHERWQAIVDDFGARARRTRLADNLIQLVAECAAVLQPRFPCKPGQIDELPNRAKEI